MLGLTVLAASKLMLLASADVATCPQQKNARVDVRWHSEPIRYDYSATTAQLNAKPIDSDNPYGVHVAVDVGGLMSGTISYKSSVGVTTLLYPASNEACLWIDTVTIDMTIDPLIQIASEHPKGSCEFAAIMEHEHKHIAIDRTIVTEYTDKIQAAAAQAVARVGMVGPKTRDTIEMYKSKMSDYVTMAVKAEADMMYAERTRRQKALDNRAEYDRVAAQCGPAPISP